MNDFDPKQFLRRDLADFTPYKANNAPYLYKLDANESPYKLPEAVKRRAIRWLEEEENLNIYPDSDSTSLRKALGEFYGVLPENITCGVGSDELIDCITKVFLETGDTAVVPRPGFVMYGHYTLLNKGKVVPVEIEAESFSDGANLFRWDEKKIVAAAKDSRAKIIFLCSPNNPTGNAMTEEQILYVLENSGSVVVLDEAYGDFSGRSMIGCVNQYKNLIVLKTFSKTFGLAGIRAGYAVGCEEIIQAVEIARPPYNLPSLTQLMAEESLRERVEYQARAREIASQRQIVMEELSRIDWIHPYPSEANFIFFESSRMICDTLEKEGLLVRRFVSPPGMEKIRLTIGTSEQNQAFFRILKKHFL